MCPRHNSLRCSSSNALLYISHAKCAALNYRGAHRQYISQQRRPQQRHWRLACVRCCGVRVVSRKRHTKKRRQRPHGLHRQHALKERLATYLSALYDPVLWYSVDHAHADLGLQHVAFTCALITFQYLPLSLTQPRTVQSRKQQPRPS